MKGVVFNLLEQVVSEEAGEAAWERAVEESGVEGAYTSLGTYSHDELAALVASLSAQLGVEPLMGYRSQRGLCYFGQGLIEGSGDYFGENLKVAQTTCEKRGDSECVFEVVVSA